MRKAFLSAATVFLALLLTICLCVACHPDDPEPSYVTVTVDFGLADTDNTTFTAEVGASFFDELNTQTKPSTSLHFDGYYLNGAQVTSATVAPDEDFTVKAHWLADCTAEIWLEQLDGGYVKDEARTLTFQAQLGEQAEVAAPEIDGYDYDASNADAVTHAVVTESGACLKLYYKLSLALLTFDKGNALSATGEMAEYSAKRGSVYTLPACAYVSQAKFVGYNTKADGTGTGYAVGDEITLSQDVTLYAVWTASVTQNRWVEDETGEYRQLETLTSEVTVGRVASADNPDPSKYETDLDRDGILVSGVVSENGLQLNAYYKLRCFTVTYADDGTTTENVRWGTEITVRTPANDDPTGEILSYCTSATGNGRDYAFGSSYTVTSDVTFYPVIIDVYTDDAGSGDKVGIRRNMTGKGAAKLTKNGEEYEGYITVIETLTGDTVEFDVSVNGETLYGKIYTDNGDKLFRYRGEEAGTYLYLDPLYYDFETQEYGVVRYDLMLALDGYGAGVLARPEENTERVESYACTYNVTPRGDYYLSGVLPATGAQVEMYFSLVNESVDLGEGVFAEGYFLQYGYVGDNVYVYYYNQQVDDSYALKPDGYGNASLYTVEVDPTTEAETLQLVSEGIYFYADYFGASEEMVFLPKTGDPFYFIWWGLGGEYAGTGLFSIRHNEYGEYAHEDSSNPSRICLDGYGGIYYSADGSRDNEREGFYVIAPTETETSFILTVSFVDDNSTLGIGIDLASNTFRLFEDGFVVVDGVLTEYLGTSSVIEIPEGVTEIAARVFADKNVTFVTFPTTLQKIGDYAFENSASSGRSVLKTAYFKSATPPELGADVFRWISGNLKIFVPDGSEEAYRTAATWTAATPSLSGGYAQFVTSNAEQANKPLYEIKDGVLVSYNNKDADPHDVHISIPDEAVSIADGVFAGLDYIVSADLNNVVNIGANAFRGCANLGSVTFNSATVSVGAYAFYECALTQLELGSVESIGELAFARNFGLVSVSFDGAVGSIGNRAFYECGRETNADETEVTPLEFVISFADSAVPVLNGLPFDGVLALRVYVNSYETGVAFAESPNGNWARYSSSLRVKADTAEYWYSKAQAAAKLEIGDRIMFYDTYFGLYKREGSVITVSWFEYSSLSLTLTVIENRLTIGSNGEMTGMDVSAVGDSDEYVFVRKGTVITYLNGAETLQITFGGTAGKFCGEDVTFDYSNYRTHFTYDGYVYTVSLYNDCTFTYTKSKIVTQTTYTAADGSTLTVYDGNYITANGTLKNVDGNGLEKSTETQGWFLTKLSPDVDNVYVFTVYHLNDTYRVVVYLDAQAGTFTYECSLSSSIITYRDASTGDVAIVTKSADGEVVSVHILFKTSNGTEEVNVTFSKTGDGVYTVVVDSTLPTYDEDGYVNGSVPSEFNGVYTLTLNESDKSFTLEKQQ